MYDCDHGKGPPTLKNSQADELEAVLLMPANSSQNLLLQKDMYSLPEATLYCLCSSCCTVARQRPQHGNLHSKPLQARTVTDRTEFNGP